MYTVYKHTFPNGKCYVGITKLKVNDRWRQGKGYKNQMLMFRAICKYGWDKIKHEILYTNLTKEEAEKREIELIAKHKSNLKAYGYNIENGGNCKGKMTEAERKKRSIRFRGKNNPMYGKGLKGKDNPMYGRKWTDEQKAAHSKKVKGKLVGAKNPMFGKHHTEEHKRKIGEAEKGAKNPNAKPVRCIELNKIFLCATIAGQETATNSNCISQCCHGKIKTAGGYHWEFVDKAIIEK